MTRHFRCPSPGRAGLSRPPGDARRPVPVVLAMAAAAVLAAGCGSGGHDANRAPGEQAAATAKLPRATTFTTLKGLPEDTASTATSGVVVHPATSVTVSATPGGPPVAVLPSTQLGGPTWVPTGHPGKNPPGDNGTVKIHKTTTPDDQRRNQPHVCGFYLDGFNFDGGQQVSWYIDSWPPTGNKTQVLDGGLALGADGHGRTDDLTLPAGHYKLYWNFAGENGKAKQKVFWVKCDGAGPSPTRKPTGAPTSPGSPASASSPAVAGDAQAPAPTPVPTDLPVTG